jgi:hypothetical protein
VAKPKSKPTKSTPSTAVTQLDQPVVFDSIRHCGYMFNSIPCTRVKGQGTVHLGEGPCIEHDKDPKRHNSLYTNIRRNRLNDLIQQVRNSGLDPLDILGELELMRALALGFLQERAQLDDINDVERASDLIDKITRTAFLYQKMQQSQMIHVAFLDVVFIKMADEMTRVINSINPERSDNWKENAIRTIRDKWALIQIDPNPRELKRIMAEMDEQEKLLEDAVEGAK